MPKIKNIPVRMCIACREMKPKNEMLRVVKTADGEIYADPTGKASGRGAYICNATECRDKLSSKKLLHKTFSTNVAPEVYQEIEEDALGKK